MFNSGDLVFYEQKENEKLYYEECFCTFIKLIDEKTCSVKKNMFGQQMEVELNRITHVSSINKE